MRGFRPVDGWYVAGLGPTEREVFATVVADVAELLGAGRFGTEPSGAEPSGPPTSGAGSADARGGTGGTGPLDHLRMSTGSLPAPDDPAVRRLLPDASRDDPAVAAEFRRLTEEDLRSTKVERLRSLWRALLEPAAPPAPRRFPWSVVDDDDDLVVPRAEAAAFAAALTDVRLVLAERLGLRTEEDADRLYATLEEQAAAEEDDGGLGPAADDDRPAREILEAEMRAYLGSVYAALSWLQETLMAALLADLEPGAG